MYYARLRGEMENFWLYVDLLTTNGCCRKLHPWAGACSPEGSLRRETENARPEPAFDNATTDSCPMGYTHLHMSVSQECRL